MRWRLLAFGAALVVLLLSLVVAVERAPAGPSSLSPAASGWLAARRYLEHSGISIKLLDGPWDRPEATAELAEADTMLITFPWFRPASPSPAPLRRHLQRGGTLVLAYSGSDTPYERHLFAALEMPLRRVRPRAPLNPLSWRRYQRRTLDLQPPGGEQLTARIRFPEHAPQIPPDADRLWTASDAPVAIFTVRRGKGSIVVLPGETLANGRLAAADNARLLATLLKLTGERWLVDEFHHGLTTPVGEEADQLSNAVRWLLLHLALIYGCVLWTASRRFGPPWPSQPATRSSSTSFLLGLGHLHDRLGHHRMAIDRLVELLTRYHPEALPAAEPDLGASVGRARFVELLNELLRHRAPRATRRGRWS